MKKLFLLLPFAFAGFVIYSGFLIDNAKYTGYREGYTEAYFSNHPFEITHHGKTEIFKDGETVKIVAVVKIDNHAFPVDTIIFKQLFTK